MHIVKKIILGSVLVLSIGLHACKKNESYCGVKNPETEILWIKNVIETSPHGLQIYKLTYKTTEGFYIRFCINSDCSATAGVYRTCDNIQLYESSTGVMPSTFPTDFNAETSYKELIYQK